MSIVADINEETGYPDLTHRQTVAIFCSLMLGMLLAALDQTIVSTALPRITGDLGGLQHISWVISAYLLTATVAMPLYGKLGDLFGRKLFFQIAIVVFLIGSVLAGTSQTFGQLIAFRALQGLGAGGLLVLAMTIIGETVSPRERGRYQGYFGAMFGLSSVMGPLIGGFITDNLSWRWVFYVNVPLGIVALVLVAAVLPKGSRHERPVIDWLGAALLTATVTLIVLITTWGGVEYAWGSGVILGLTAVAVLLFVVLIAVERRAPEPMLPVRLFRIPTFSVSTLVSFIVGVAMFGSIGFLPLYMQAVTGASATASGLALFPMMGGVVISSVIAGRIITKTGKYKAWPVSGTLIASLGIVLLSTIGADTSRLTVSAFMFVLGIGIGMVMQIMVLSAQNAVPLSFIGTATGTINFCREIGGCIGIAAFGAVFTSGLHARLGSFGKSTGLSLEIIKKLPRQEQVKVVSAIADSIAHVFVFAIPVMLTAFAVSWLLKEIPLRHSTTPVEHPATVEVVPEPALERV